MLAIMLLGKQQHPLVIIIPTMTYLERGWVINRRDNGEVFLPYMHLPLVLVAKFVAL